MKKECEYDFEDLKNRYVASGDYERACFWQSLHIKMLELGRHGFKGGGLRQEYDILSDLVKTVFLEENNDMTILLPEIAGFTLLEDTSKEYQKSCGKISQIFRKTWNRKAEVLLTVLVGNINCIKERLDELFFNRYVNNVLLFIKKIYGYESREYARIYLYFLCEGRYDKNAGRKGEFIDHYEYFREHLEGHDIYYALCLFPCILFFLEHDKQKYEYWLGELTRAIETNKVDKKYPVLMCQYGYIRAAEYEKNNDILAAIGILNKIICLYILPEMIPNNIFQVAVLLKAVVYCNALNDYGTMIEYARKGVSICEKLQGSETETYYEIYNYIGIKMIYDKRYAEAQEFYSLNSRKIRKKFGIKCENYFYYVNNLGLAYFQEGRVEDAFLCFDELSMIEGEEFEGLKRNLIFRNFYYFDYCLDGNRQKINKYVRKYLSQDSLREGSNIGLKILWLAAALNDEKPDFKTMDSYFKEICSLYRKGKLSEHFKVSFENCMTIYQWKKGKKEFALELSSKIVDRLNHKIFLYDHIETALNHLKLLVGNADYKNAKIFCERLIDHRYEEILAKGLGEITAELSAMRIAMSYYINLIDKYFGSLYQDGLFCTQLLEKIVNCKTVEKDILSFVGKYDSEQEDIRFKLYQFRDMRRKINALEMRKDIMERENSDEDEKRRDDLDKEIFKYTLELSDLEIWLSKRINLKEFIKMFQFRNISLPDQAVALEFFGYLDLDFDMREIDYDNIGIKYICLAVSSKKDNARVSYAGSFYDDEYMLQEYGSYFFNKKGVADETQIRDIKESFSNALLPVIEPHIGKNKTVYWGMDAEMHIIPVEWILGKKYESMVSIHMDSVKYIRNDENLDFGNSSSLIMGRPEYAIDKNLSNQDEELLCSEIECREIAKIIGGKALLGREANLHEFNEKCDSNILHISTHGTTEHADDVFFEKNKLKYSHILLSGYSDWSVGRKIEEYGNGTITADDICYINMKNTKLAVIASCLSGFANVNLLLGNVYCIRWALGVAGARFSVTALWKTDDVATSIFMVLFYRYLESFQVGVAFHMAKSRLKFITREEIKNDAVLKNLFEQYKDMEGYGKILPFQEDKYWAAFTCYCS